jgi:hypothetical protein
VKTFDRRQKTIFNSILDRRPQSPDLDFNELCNYLRDCNEVVPPYYLRRAKLPSELSYAQVIELIEYGFEQFCFETLDELAKAGLLEKRGCFYRRADLPPERRAAILKELGIDDAD